MLPSVVVCPTAVLHAGFVAADMPATRTVCSAPLESMTKWPLMYAVDGVHVDWRRVPKASEDVGRYGGGVLRPAISSGVRPASGSMRFGFHAASGPVTS